MDTTIVEALKENKCCVCGTKNGKQVKVGSDIYTVNITVKYLMPICNLCLEHYPSNLENLTYTQVCWHMLEKRLNQHDVYTRICECGCGTPIVTTRGEKKFASNNCRSRYWQRNLKEKP